MNVNITVVLRICTWNWSRISFHYKNVETTLISFLEFLRDRKERNTFKGDCYLIRFAGK